MPNFVWVVEHRQMNKGVMDSVVMYIATTLTKAEALMRLPSVKQETQGWYTIYPEVVDEDHYDSWSWPDTYLTPDKRNSIIYFYDLQGILLGEQPIQ